MRTFATGSSYKRNPLVGGIMFKVIQKGTNRLDIELSGKLNTEEMKIALDELINKSKEIEKGKMLYDVIDFHLPSLGALAIEFSRLPSMFGFIKKFDRAAVLTDKNWIKKVSEFEGMLIPGLEIKAFDRDQKDEAERWLSS
jgi:hypothetical protein